ncbi:NAD(P)-binding protein [Frateuria aurantia]
MTVADERDDKREDRRLGMDRDMTRRDFLNHVMLGSGASLLGAVCPAHAMNRAGLAADESAARAFDGYSGVGDYAGANGNVFSVVQSAHRIRDGLYQAHPPTVKDTGERYDLVIVGGGLSGLMAAHQYQKLSGGSRRCLIIENHPIFGGEARQNDFLVDGIRLTGPQGSNDFAVPEAGSGSLLDEFFSEFEIPRAYEWQSPASSCGDLRFARDNYSNMDGFQEQLVDVAYYFGQRDGLSKPAWINNIWSDQLARTPFSAKVRGDLLHWRSQVGQLGDEDPRKLDQMTYQHYLEQVKGYDPAVTRFAQPMVGLLGGVSADAVSARLAHGLVMGSGRALTLSYPGGNAVFARYLVNALVPGVIEGRGFPAMLSGQVRLDRLDRTGQPTRMRLRSTVIRVAHHGSAGAADGVEIQYERAGEVHAVRARTVIMATGGWVTKHVLADLPEPIRQAYQQFVYAPALIANVAVHNWRFLRRLNATAARWMDDGTMFGFAANIRQTMVGGAYQPPLDPARPALLTFYMGLYTPGHDAHVQGVLGRTRLLATRYADYERSIRRQMTTMFGSTGFDAARDIAGIVLNRWGHARVVQPPGFYYGLNGQPSPREVVARGYGRVIIAHSELNGAQNYRGAFEHGTRAARQALEMS